MALLDELVEIKHPLKGHPRAKAMPLAPCKASRIDDARGWPVVRCPLSTVEGTTFGVSQLFDPSLLIDWPSGVRAHSLASLDAALEGCFGSSPSALAPCASVLITHRAETLYERGFAGAGVDTIYDLASVTKAAVTAPLLMGLVEAGTVQLDQPVAAWLPEWNNTPFAAVTMRMLLAHRSGLWEWRPVYLHSSDMDRSIAFVASTQPRYEPGAGHHYSDLGLMLAGDELDRHVDRFWCGEDRHGCAPFQVIGVDAPSGRDGN